MNVLEIVLQRPAAATPTHYPIISEFTQDANFLAARREGTFMMDAERLTQLRAQETNPLNYGTILGQALFCNTIRDAFMQARAQSQDNLRLLLVNAIGTEAVLQDETFDISHIAGPDQQTLVLYSYGDAITTFSSIYLWDTNGRQLFGELPTSMAGTHLALSPDGQTLIMSGQLGDYSFEGTSEYDPYTLHFTIGFSYWQERACTLANRNLSEAEWAAIIPPGEPYQTTCP